MRKISRWSMAALAGVTLLSTGTSLSFYEESLPTTMNPIYADTMVDNRVHELLFDRLYFHSPINNELTSRLVTNWATAEGGYAIRLELKRGLTWHDGVPFSAADVCFTIDAMLDPGTTSPLAEKQRAVFEGCDVERDLVALVHFKKIFYNPRERMGFYVIPAHPFEGVTAIPLDHEFSARPLGTGPAKGARGRRGVLFEKAQNGHHSPNIVGMDMQAGGDSLVQVRTLQNNGVQGIISVPPTYRADVTASDELALKSYDLRSWWFVAVNQDKPYLSDSRVRQALNLILDRTDLRQLAVGVGPSEQNSPCEFISGPFVQSSPYYNRSVPVQARSDLDEADRLLTEVGFEKIGGRWHFEGEPVVLQIGIKASLDVETSDLLSQIGNQLGEAGFGRQQKKVGVDDWSRLALTGRMTEFDLLVGKWSFGLVEDVNHLFHTREDGEGARNIFGYSNPEVDALLEAYGTAITETQAQDAYHELHQLLAQELPYLFLWKLDTKSAWRTDVRGNTIAPYYYWTEFDSWRYTPPG